MINAVETKIKKVKYFLSVDLINAISPSFSNKSSVFSSIDSKSDSKILLKKPEKPLNVPRYANAPDRESNHSYLIGFISFQANSNKSSNALAKNSVLIQTPKS